MPSSFLICSDDLSILCRFWNLIVLYVCFSLAFLISVVHSSIWFLLSLLPRCSEEEHFRGEHLFSSYRPTCPHGSLGVPQQEIISEEPDVPELGIPQQSHSQQCTAALWACCRSCLNMLEQLAFSWCSYAEEPNSIKWPRSVSLITPGC